MKKPKMITGNEAIKAANNGATLYVLDITKGWIVAPNQAATLKRANSFPSYANWIYGVKG